MHFPRVIHQDCSTQLPKDFSKSCRIYFRILQESAQELNREDSLKASVRNPKGILQQSLRNHWIQQGDIEETLRDTEAVLLESLSDPCGTLKES